MEAVLRARTLLETRGFIKALVEIDSDRILGFTVFGVDAGEVMTSVQTAMVGGLPYTVFRNSGSPDHGGRPHTPVLLGPFTIEVC